MKKRKEEGGKSLDYRIYPVARFQASGVLIRLPADMAHYNYQT
jgi:hypothetical protein